MSLKVKDVMVTDLVTANADMSVREATKRMNDYEIGCLLVVEAESIIGILTERDVLRNVVAEARDPEKTLVKEVMSTPVIVVDPEKSLEEAVTLMFEKRVKKLPVVKDKKLVGLVTLTDIARIQPVMAKFIKNLAVGQALPKRMEKVVHYYIA